MEVFCRGTVSSESSHEAGCKQTHARWVSYYSNTIEASSLLCSPRCITTERSTSVRITKRA
eukprot:1775601-Alexandrium_andersonii.AAC.1